MNQGMDLVSRFLCLLLSGALLALHPLPAKTIYYCSVSRAYLPECCCKVGSPGCGKARSSSSATGCCPEPVESSHRGENPSWGTGILSAASCACCEVAYREGCPIPTAARAGEGEREQTRNALASSPEFLTTLRLSVPVRRGLLLALERSCRHPPLYILYSSFLC